MPKILSICLIFLGAVAIVVILTSVLKERSEPDIVSTFKPAIIRDLKIDSFISRIKVDTSLNADHVQFVEEDSVLFIYMEPKVGFQDSVSSRWRFQLLPVTTAFRKAKNISGLVFMRTPDDDSVDLPGYKYQILCSFFKQGSRYAGNE